MENNTNAIPNTYIKIKLRIEINEIFIPVIITTAKEEAQGSIPVNNPTVIGLSIFDLVIFP